MGRQDAHSAAALQAKCLPIVGVRPASGACASCLPCPHNADCLPIAHYRRLLLLCVCVLRVQEPSMHEMEFVLSMLLGSTSHDSLPTEWQVRPISPFRQRCTLWS